MSSDINSKIIVCVERVTKKNIDSNDLDINIIEEYGIDSLAIANILTEVETEMGIEIDVSMIIPSNIRSINAMSSMVSELVKQEAVN